MISRVAMLIALLIVVGIVLFIVVRNWPERGPAVGQVTGSPIAGDEVVLLVNGWSDAELRSIVSDFETMYGLPTDSFRIIADDGGPTQIQIAESIGSDLLTFLVNYLHYPENRNLQGRTVAAIAVVKRSEVMGGPSELAERRATIYVPANDTEFDQVFVRIDPARYFRISFTRLQWMPVDEGLEPRAVQDLARNAPY